MPTFTRRDFLKLTAAGIPALAAAARLGLARSAEDPFVVHEWGTFTSMAGSDGAILEGLQNESERLPAFVYSRTDAAESPLHPFGDSSLTVPAIHVHGKMETPVLYFYSKSARRVSVDVTFQDGLLTQWYPRASRATPEMTAAPQAASPLDLDGVRRSTLGWDVDLVPFAAAAPAEIPKVASDVPWSFAREVQAASVRVANGKQTEAERYIFYRGLGRLPVPVEIGAYGNAVTRLCNRGEAIPAAFVLEMGQEKGRYHAVGAIPAMQPGYSVLTNTAWSPRAEIIASMEREVAAALMAQGLYRDEALAMVRTWSSTWFGQEGSRLIYLVPRAVTDRVLPLTITPQPDELTRVLVGRLEFLTPETEAELGQALLQGDLPRLARFGRFLEPAVRRASGSGDPRVKSAALEMLDRLKRG